MIMKRTYIGRALTLCAALAAGGAAGRPAMAASGPGDIVGQCTAAYQGWFSCNEKVPGWIHWSSDGNIPTLSTYDASTYPDMRPYASGTYQTSCPNLNNGMPATLYSSYDTGVIKLQLNWMKSNGMNTIAIGRFNPTGGYPDSDYVPQNVKAAAPATGMKYYISYDLTGWANAPTECPADWTNHIVGGMSLPSQANYAKQNGKPVVELWGIGVEGNVSLTPAQSLSLIQWFQNQGCYVIVGTSWAWRWGTYQQPYLPCMQTANMIQPWTVGTIGDISGADGMQSTRQADLAWCNTNGNDYQECIIPGDLGQHQRVHGNFMWEQFANLTTLGVKSAFISMFDEFGEGNQIMPTAEDQTMSPSNPSGVTLLHTGTTTFAALDEDGTHCSSDYYMRLVNDGWKMMNSQIPLTYTRPTPPVRKLVPGTNVSLLAAADSKYVSADNSGASPLIANRTTHAQWETFTVVDMGNNNIALKSYANGLYVSASGSNPLIANHTTAGSTETFTECDAGSGNIALRSVANNQYVCADNAGANPLIANRTTYGSWETFSVVSSAPYAAALAATPVLSPGPGSYTGPQTVTLTSSTPGAAIYYTTNGTTPTRLCPSVASGSTITVTASGTVKAMTTAAGYTDSALAAAAYTIPKPLQIAAGSAMAAGNFVADIDYTGGSTYYSGGIVNITAAGAVAAPEAVYRRMRYGAVTYTIPSLTVGHVYTVRLHFAETFFTASGQRVFNVAINGSSVLSNFDVYAAGGANNAVVRTFTATAPSTGKITIAFTNGTADSPMVSGIEVIN